MTRHFPARPGNGTDDARARAMRESQSLTTPRMQFPLHRTCALLAPCAMVLGLAVACGDSTNNASPAGDAGAFVQSDAASEASASDAPTSEASKDKSSAPSRPVATACQRTSPRPASNATSDAGADASIECTLDSECTAKADGRCDELHSLIWFGNESLGTRCTYDACTTDEECGGAVCGCALGFGGQNVCLSRSNCRVDADCSQGQVCGFSRPFIMDPPGVVVTGDEQGSGNNAGPREALGWFCTTPTDDCLPGQSKDGGATEGCVYSPAVGHWIWWYQP